MDGINREAIGTISTVDRCCNNKWLRNDSVFYNKSQPKTYLQVLFRNAVAFLAQLQQSDDGKDCIIHVAVYSDSLICPQRRPFHF
jgi:hypothetical protein